MWGNLGLVSCIAYHIRIRTRRPVVILIVVAVYIITALPVAVPVAPALACASVGVPIQESITRGVHVRHSASAQGLSFKGVSGSGRSMRGFLGLKFYLSVLPAYHNCTAIGTHKHTFIVLVVIAGRLCTENYRAASSSKIEHRAMPETLRQTY